MNGYVTTHCNRVIWSR